MWSSISWSTLDLFFELTGIDEQKSDEKDSFGMWSSISWSTLDLFFELTGIDEQKSYEKDSFGMWSLIGWSSVNIFLKGAENYNTDVLKNIHRIRDLWSGGPFTIISSESAK
jgi:hypothetical protein